MGSKDSQVEATLQDGNKEDEEDGTVSFFFFWSIYFL